MGRLARSYKIGLVCLLAVTTVAIGCGKTSGVAPSEFDLSKIIESMPPEMPTDGTNYYALVYGSTQSDRTNLSNRIAGYQAPGLAEVFSNWRRFSGAAIYNNATDLSNAVAAATSVSYCFSGLNASYNWNPATNPVGGATIQPGTHTACVNNDAFNASSWSYIGSPDRIYNAANGSNYTGFLSALPFSKFNLQAEVSSADSDNDNLGLIIAAYVDNSNNLQVLAAIRTQGGFAPTQGWAILHLTNGVVTRSFGAKSVGGTNNAWSGRRSLLRIERDGDIVKAYASAFATGNSALSIDPASEISLDLSDPANNLTGFQGEKYYGYTTMSQLGATFTNIEFTTPNSLTDPTYIYDLMNNTVYVKDSSNGYVMVPGAQARTILGFPRRYRNTETQKDFMINSATDHTEL